MTVTNLDLLPRNPMSQATQVAQCAGLWREASTETFCTVNGPYLHIMLLA